MEETPTTSETPNTSEVSETPSPQPVDPLKTTSKPTLSFNLQLLMVPLLVAFVILAGFLVHEITVVKSSLDDKNKSLDKRLVTLEQPNNYVNEQIDKTKFQAVFLVGGQVYFGKISHIDQNTLTLTDIYYIKSGDFSKDQVISGDNVSLLKLGNEVHAPQDQMNIERKNVIFWENLKDNGKVVQAIQAYEKNNKK